MTSLHNKSEFRIFFNRIFQPPLDFLQKNLYCNSMSHLLAAGTLPGGQTLQAPANVPTGGIDLLSKVLKNGLNIFIIAAIVLCLFSIAWAGFQWASSSGDKERVAHARLRMTWAIVGLVVVFATFFILNLIAYFFNVPLWK